MYEQLQMRAAMGGDKERVELAAFEDLWGETIADALAELRKEAEALGVDVWTWLASQGNKDEVREGVVAPWHSFQSIQSIILTVLEL